MKATLQDRHTSKSIGGRPLSNFCFADDIDRMAGSNSEVKALTNKFAGSASFTHKQEQGHGKLIVSSIRLNGMKLDEVRLFPKTMSVWPGSRQLRTAEVSASAPNSLCPSCCAAARHGTHQPSLY